MQFSPIPNIDSMYWKHKCYRLAGCHPFGSVIPGRVWASSTRDYRFTFNGKEIDYDLFNSCIVFEARIFNSNLGRFLSLDPLDDKYPWQTPFAYFKNSPIFSIDYQGKGNEPDHYSPDAFEAFIDNEGGAPSIEKFKTKVKNSISIDEFGNGNIYFTTFKVRGRNIVDLQFDAAGIPDQLDIYKVYLFVFRVRIKTTGMMIGQLGTGIRLTRGRYFIRVTPGTPTSIYRLNLHGALVKHKEVHKHKGRIGGKNKTKTGWLNSFEDPERSKVKRVSNIPSNKKD